MIAQQRKNQWNFKKKECSVCGETFMPIVGNQKTCSKICSKELHRQQSKAQHFVNKEKEKKQRKIYYKKNKKKILNDSKKYRQKNKIKSIAAVKKWNYNNKDKSKAHHEIRKAVLRKEIPKVETLKCKKCNNQAKHYHHPDYSKPFLVIPLCAQCHKEEHKNEN